MYSVNSVQAITYPWVLTPIDHTYKVGYFKIKKVSLKATFLKISLDISLFF